MDASSMRQAFHGVIGAFMVMMHQFFVTGMLM